MKKILHIISSPKGEASQSIKLGNAIVERLQQEHPGSVVTENNLAQHYFPHLEGKHLAAFFTPEESRTPENRAAIKPSDDAIKEIMDADLIVIGVPVYNFGIHSALKSWIDNIVRAGVTFKYDENGPKGLITEKKVYLAIASGGVLSEGPMKAMDFTEPYLRAILGFIGLDDIVVFRVEGSAIPGIQETALEKGIGSIRV